MVSFTLHGLIIDYWQKINIGRLSLGFRKCWCIAMSFGPRVFSGVQEMLVLALMLVSVFAIFYVNIDVTYKIGMIVIVFAVVFLTTLATQMLKQQQAEVKKAAAV